MSKVNKKQIKDVADKSETIGNECFKKYQKSKRLDVAKVGISAFRNTLYANSLLIKADKDE
jgi:hypothetical protein